MQRTAPTRSQLHILITRQLNLRRHTGDAAVHCHTSVSRVLCRLLQLRRQNNSTSMDHTLRSAILMAVLGTTRFHMTAERKWNRPWFHATAKPNGLRLQSFLRVGSWEPDHGRIWRQSLAAPVVVKCKRDRWRRMTCYCTTARCQFQGAKAQFRYYSTECRQCCMSLDTSRQQNRWWPPGTST